MTIPYDINEAGQIVGSWHEYDQRTARQPWVWDPTTQEMTMLVAPGPDALARAINDLGQIVGTSDGRALLWNPI